MANANKRLVTHFLNEEGKGMVKKPVPQRNEKCYCGSGLKYKNCCISKLTNPYLVRK